MNEKSFGLQRFAPLCMLLLLSLSLVGNFVPQANAEPTLASKVTATASISGDIKAVDVTTNGTVFAQVDSDVYRSYDLGVSWTKVLDRPSGQAFMLRVDSQNRIFTAAYNSTGGTSHNDIYRSVDYGNTWTLVLGEATKVWRLAEMSNGTLLMNTYSTSGDDLIYQSDDGGLTWAVWQNLTSWNNDHMHFVRVNPYNQDIWIGLGDKSLSNVPTLARWSNGASSWTILYNTTNDSMFTDIIFTSSYAYLIPDRSTYKIFKLPHRGLWNDKVEVLNIWEDDTTIPAGIPYSMMGAVYDDGLIIVPTDRETVMTSVDGDRWLKVFQTTYEGTGAWRFDCVSQRQDSNGYWYFLSDYDEIIYRSSITANDVRQQFAVLYNEFLGTIATQQMRIPVENDSSISFNSPTSMVLVTAVGLAQGNFVLNPSFETGDLSGWKNGTTGTAVYSVSVTGSQSYHGTKSLMIDKVSGSGTFWIETITPIDLNEYGEYFLGTLYMLSQLDWESTISMRIGYYVGSTWTSIASMDGYPYTEWASLSLSARSLTARKIYLRIVVNAGLNDIIYLDSIIFERKVSNYLINKVNNGDTVVYKAEKTIPTPSTELYGYTETQNIAITILNHGSLIHSGNLSEGATVSKILTLSTNIVDLYIQVAGSRQLLLIITYGYPKLVLTTAELKTETFSDNKLTLIIDSPSGTTSTTKVFVGDKGKPMKLFINNVERLEGDGWNYNDTTKTLTIIINHLGEGIKEIVVDWRMPGDVNGDGIVDTLDLTRVAKAYGSTPNKPLWDADADLNKDNIVNIYDLEVVGKNYGKSKS